MLGIFSRIKMSKNALLFTLLAPTLFITVPLIIASYFHTGYFTYYIILIVINIGLSYSDFVCIHKIHQAPKKCIIENDGASYDILV
ncbi:DUF3267 domain-containing protein [Natronobacillus azotifigens]|uniref:DUF3267 domain-containing protein n=1 Tax=Natronobacillus azotifigens TaxID=472978 RepID=UPI003AF05923